MGQIDVRQQRRWISVSYLCMFLALFSLIFAVLAYFLARKVAFEQSTEVWINAQALWVMRSVAIFLMLGLFGVLWFIPLLFLAWNSAIWVTACTIAGVVFLAIAWLFLLNAWIKGFFKFVKNKPVF